MCIYMGSCVDMHAGSCGCVLRVYVEVTTKLNSVSRKPE